MLFPSEVFMWVFLPVVLTIYYLFRKNIAIKNIVLLISSLYFYAWGEPVYVFLMIFVIIVNYFAGISISRLIGKEKKSAARVVLIAASVCNLSILAWYKYSSFSVLQINRFFKSNITVPQVALPIGISFFTFQALSYIIDVYRKNATAQVNPLYVGLYISFFPQLIAGPIVRYSVVENQITNRKESLELFSEGVIRFLTGLIKKVIIANNMAIVADMAFKYVINREFTGSTVFAWLGAISYTLQIFYDFSGYSDMAIGLGKMFGFEFEENFNYPYIASSVTDFWRRWHISLSTWFRDYVYIPLGGNRVKPFRHVINLFVVWLLTGIWHGANFTFVAWGLLYFIVLVAEKYTGLDKVKKWWGHIYTLLIICVAWVIFRANNLGDAAAYLKGMFTWRNIPEFNAATFAYLKQFVLYYVLAVAGSIPVNKWIRDKLGKQLIFEYIYGALIAVASIIAMTYIVNNAYSPFIYYNF